MGRIRWHGVRVKTAIWLLVAVIPLVSCSLGFQQIDPDDLKYEPFIPPTLMPTSLPTFTPQPLEQQNESGSISAQENGESELQISGGADCVDNLTFISDLTIEDGTVVVAGSTLDKQWEVENSGTCNWDENYSIQLISGPALGEVTEAGLVPARAGSRVTIRIVFTAPEEPGIYNTAWQAHNPQGIAFGDPIFMYIEIE